MNTPQEFTRLNQTLAKIDEFSTYETGWDFGRGQAIEKYAIQLATDIVRRAFSIGIWKSSAFPTPSGQILLAFPISKALDVEIYINRDQTFDFRCEKDGRETESREDLTLDETISLLNIYGNENIIEKCLSEFSIMKSITMPRQDDFEAPHLSLPLTGVYRYSTENAFNLILQVPANTSQGTIRREYPASPPITGAWPNYLQTPSFTLRELNMTRAT